MPRQKQVTLTGTDIEKLTTRLSKILATKGDIESLGEDIVFELRKIQEYLFEMRAEMREIHELYMFIAKQHLTPELAEKYLKEARKN
jgi:hypothetical protein